MSRPWQVWIDTGGTFTDAVALDPAGRIRRAKVLSTSALRGTVERRLAPARLLVRESWDAPADFVAGFTFRLLGRDARRASARGGAREERTVVRFDPVGRTLDLDAPLAGPIPAGAAFEVRSPEESPVLAARLLAGVGLGAALPPMKMRVATTLGTNALLERRGAPTALFITQGFGDLLRIGTQQRPELFALDVRKPEPLHSAVVEVVERLAADGSVIAPLDPESVEAEARRLARRGIRAAAVALLHAWRNPEHEIEVEAILRRCGFRHVSRSSDLAPTIRLLHRAETATVDAYLSPPVREYLDRVGAPLPAGALHVMTSAGGLVSPSAFRPKDSLSSGPAGGVVGAALAGRRSGFTKLLAFDMGGTSTDVARHDRRLEYVFEQEIGGVRLLAPALAIESVAAGGGSICRFDGERLRVGPESAGARPGPACYGAGGPLTLTDVNLLLGRLDPSRFPIPISIDAARKRFEELRRVVGRAGEPLSLLEGLVEIADERMADAIRGVSVRRGYDPADHALVAFGGAGGQHACGVAERLGIRAIVIPADAGLLSALGLGHAILERFAERQVLAPLDTVERRVDGWLDALGAEAVAAVASEGVPASEVVVRRRLAHLRFVGQDATVEVEIDRKTRLADAFAARYRRLFGHRPERRAIELESLRVVASTRERTPARARPPARRVSPAPDATARARFGGRWRRTPVFDRDRLAPGARLDGPALVLERHGATVVAPGWGAAVDGAGAIVLRRRSRGEGAGPRRARPEAVRLELFTNRFAAIAREMGERLRRTAVSTNVKERLDYSCAVLDPGARLVVNAPHIPVHLGALGLCARLVKDALPLGPGDVAVTNHPAYGGSHLPDITVLTPVFEFETRSARGRKRGRARPRLLGYVASRAHHAEIGGSRPGSMPPAATTLAEEGVVIPPAYLIRKGRADWAGIRARLLAPPWPSRAIEDNLADLRAAVAANHAGAEALRALAREHGAATLARYMKRIERLAERRLREALGAIPDGRYEATETLDDGSPLRARVEIRGERAAIGFAGSAGTHLGNLNATPAIVRSVVIYVLRLLVRERLPLNEGLLRPIDLSIPAGILSPEFGADPARSPAVVGGNVETSQRLVDALLRALGLAACSQGTMNNLLFGSERLAYYETVCGGCGAGPGFDGASAVHSHMTNTRITDPEVLEHRYPVRLVRFAIRRGSGGAGRHRGGDGAIREIEFLESLSLSLLTQHRVVAPYGLEGGRPGRRGAQRLARASGEVVDLGPIDHAEVGPGDRLVLETPGGGGWGSPAGARGSLELTREARGPDPPVFRIGKGRSGGRSLPQGALLRPVRAAFGVCGRGRVSGSGAG